MPGGVKYLEKKCLNDNFQKNARKFCIYAHEHAYIIDNKEKFMKKLSSLNHFESVVKEYLSHKNIKISDQEKNEVDFYHGLMYQNTLILMYFIVYAFSLEKKILSEDKKLTFKHSVKTIGKESILGGLTKKHEQVLQQALQHIQSFDHPSIVLFDQLLNFTNQCLMESDKWHFEDHKKEFFEIFSFSIEEVIRINERTEEKALKTLGKEVKKNPPRT